MQPISLKEPRVIVFMVACCIAPVNAGFIYQFLDYRWTKQAFTLISINPTFTIVLFKVNIIPTLKRNGFTNR